MNYGHEKIVVNVSYVVGFKNMNYPCNQILFPGDKVTLKKDKNGLNRVNFIAN